MISLNDVLLAMSNIPVDDPIAEIWGRGLQGGDKIIEYTGSLPITITANGNALIDYRIYGTDSGAGVVTENLFDIREVNNPPKCTYSGSIFTLTGQGSNYDVLCKTNGIGATPIPERMIAVSPGTYTITLGNGTTAPSNSRFNVRFFNGERVTNPISQDVISSHSRTFTVENNGYLSIIIGSGDIKIAGLMITKGSTAPTSYIPYGYKLPMTVQSANLFDGEMESGYYDNNGEKQSNLNWIRCKNLISVNSNTVYQAIIDNQIGATGSVVFARCYDARGEYIGTANQTVIQYYKQYVFTTLDDTGFISFYISNSYAGMKIEIYQGQKTTQTYPVYIGENQLNENEYVSYGEQKIYRDVSGILTPTDPPVPFPEIPTIDGTTIIDYDGDPKPSQMYVKYKGKG